ncbi:hypothetical protein ABGB19_14750 [Mycobacterium sp. B14F4]|uniref:DUF7159 family protein n=1 Tax=Mycobacterium sp. B14F4 TaxID=3153565 RepID=UPI00325DEA1E
METVLGLSMTSNSIGWVLLDGADADATTLDHDHFDLVADAAIDGDIAKHQSAVRGAQAIAAASGHQVSSIAVTWTDDVDAKAALLLKSLPDMGFENVVAVPLPEAARLWAGAHGRTLGFDRYAVCVVESSAVTVASVLYDTARTARTQMRESADGLGRWLGEAFESLRAQPEGLYLMGSRGDLELIAGPLEEALRIPVVASDDAQLVLARGAALKAGAAPTPSEAEGPATRPVKYRPRPARRYRFGPHARAATVLTAGVIALFAFGPELAGQSESAPPENRPSADASALSAASNSSTTSVRVHAVPLPAAVPAAPTAQPLAVVPAPPPETLPVDDIAPVAQPEVVEQPIVEPAAAVEETVEAVEAQPAVAPPTPVVQPVAAVPAPPAPEPAAAAPVAVPGPNPVAPPDPIAAALSPIFGGLP